jgi:hypothetical protein
MDDGMHADANKAEAVPTESRTLGFFFVRLPLLRNFRSDKVEKWEARNNLQGT